MMHIHASFKFNHYHSTFISNDDVRNLNRYNLCDKIVADTDLIRSTLEQHVKLFNDKTNETSRKSQNLEVNTDLTLGRNFDLITQQPPLDLSIGSPSTSTVKRPRLDEEANKQRTDIQLDTNKKVIRLDKAIVWKSSRIKYPTLWSDNSITLEDGEYLMSNWSEQYRDQQIIDEARSSARQAGIIPQLANTRDPYLVRQADPSKMSSSRRIIRLDQAIRQNRRIKFLSLWSDGSVTFEDIRHLSEKGADQEYAQQIALDKARSKFIQESDD